MPQKLSSEKQIRVLIADDHAIFREGLGFILEANEDITVVGQAADGRQAIREAKRTRPDVVILDIAMPELNGIEAARKILEEGAAPGVIILSMHCSSEHIFQALEAGAKGFVVKGAAGKELIQAVRAVYAGGRFLSQQVDDILVDDYLFRRKNPQPKSPLESLSPREREILQLVVEGKTNAVVAGILYISPKTVETYRSRLMQKLGIKDIANLVKFALEHGLTSLK